MKHSTETASILREETAGYAGSIVIYNAPDGSFDMEVRLEKETIWLSQKQMAGLFATERSVITKHLRNIFRSGELSRQAVSAKFAHTASDGKKYQVDFFNLDAIISVGYRVNSRRGTQFRMWATQILREHILKGYSVNERRLKELRQSIRLIGKALDTHDMSSDQARALLHVVTDYERALDILDDYDHQRLYGRTLPYVEAVGIRYDEAVRIIDQMRRRFNASELFGREKDDSLRSSLAAIMQTFDGEDLYPALEEKAAHLLYFLVKNHSFVDGNKRIAAALFLCFMEKNGRLYSGDGVKRIADATLVAMTLLIAESDPLQKDILTRILANLLHEGDTRY
jgi:prophage maintenance system killer protein